MLFCAYCGKSFTRKEHLERHIPSHTNVKPYRCGSCQLSFSRRDLLQRHHSTYHEVRDPTQPLSAPIPTLAGRTPIACLNCASAKTGCDKTVPCSRCAEKNLPCAARFARRASKLLRRTATNPETSTAFDGPAVSQGPESALVISPIGLVHHPGGSISLPQHGPHTLESDLFLQSSGSSVLQDSSITGSYFDPHTFMPYSADFNDPNVPYEECLSWNDYPIDTNIYPSGLTNATFGSVPFADLSGDASSASDNDSGSYPCISMAHSRNSSVRSLPDARKVQTLEHGIAAPLQAALVAAEDAWPLAKCHPPLFSGSCPRTALLHLEYLELSSKNDSSWSSMTTSFTPTSYVVPVMERTRDRIVAITQGVLHKALSIHRGGHERRNSMSQTSPVPLDVTYLVLPPSEVFEALLQIYMHGLLLQSCPVPGGVLDTNDLALRGQASTLLVLLMIAQGASRVASDEARGLAAGLTEICRISLFDLVEKDIELSADPTVLHCALVFARLGAWSGDKWHMDIVQGQRGMYLAMLKHSGALEPQPSSFPNIPISSQPELLWRAWLEVEGMNRLVYNWVMIDLELSIFYDSTPVLQITDLQARLPNYESLWLASNSDDWLASLQDIYPNNSGSIEMQQLPPSLFELFSDFAQNTLPENVFPNMMQLRLMLHPLQSMIHQIRQTLSCFSEALISPCRDVKKLTRNSTVARLEEIQALLRSWHDLHVRDVQTNGPSAFAQSTLVLFHLLNLSIVTSFPELEKLARKDGFDGSYWDLSLRHKRCIQNSTEAIFHAGQILRIIKTTAQSDRSSWWPTAIYRASLVLWVECLSKADPNFPQQQSPGPIIAIDEAQADDQTLCSWRWNGDGIAVLLGIDGRMTKLEDPSQILLHCISLIETPSAARMADGIRRKLQRLHSCWHVSICV